MATYRMIIPIVLALLGSVAAAADAEADAAQLGNPQLLGERPNSASGKTEVSLRVYLLDIDAIDDVNERFTVDLIARATWHDPRLALPEDRRSGQNRIVPLDDIWSPHALIVNSRELTPHLKQVADIDDLGNVEYTQRYSGELTVDLQLEEFPFDVQRLPIEIVAYQYTPDELQFNVDTNIIGRIEQFSIEGWAFRILKPEFGEVTIPELGIVRPQLTYVIEATRNWIYYVWTMLLPVSLIIFMSWTAFWLQPSIVPSRIAISTASVFSLMALGYSIRLRLPPVPYLTRADRFVIGCTLLVFLSLAVSVMGSRWAAANQEMRALRLNSTARWLYVGLYLLVVAFALL